MNTYTLEAVQILGGACVTVNYGEQTQKLVVQVVDGNEFPLLIFIDCVPEGFLLCYTQNCFR